MLLLKAIAMECLPHARHYFQDLPALSPFIWTTNLGNRNIIPILQIIKQAQGGRGSAQVLQL